MKGRFPSHTQPPTLSSTLVLQSRRCCIWPFTSFVNIKLYVLANQAESRMVQPYGLSNMRQCTAARNKLLLCSKLRTTPDSMEMGTIRPRLPKPSGRVASMSRYRGVHSSLTNGTVTVTTMTAPRDLSCSHLSCFLCRPISIESSPETILRE